MQFDGYRHEKPQLVDTGRGFSVFYQQKYLYSKYDPQRSMRTAVEHTAISPHTLVLWLSPLLHYGMTELTARLPPSSFILGLECDSNLADFTREHSPVASTEPMQSTYLFMQTDSLARILQTIEQLPLYPFKKCITIQGSAGVQLHKPVYEHIEKYIHDFIARFWINRLTVMQLGRNFVKNTFRNMMTAAENRNIQFLTGAERIRKPVLVAGAGPSLDTARNFIRSHREHIFLLAVDAAVSALLPDIQPDAVVMVESQYWIDAMCIGLQKTDIPFFADLTASPRVLRSLKSSIYFFCTQYADATYLKTLYEQLQPLVLPPMGSVGLTALELAARLTEPDIPIFHTGLDFSWSSGLTHARSSGPIRTLFTSITRFRTVYQSAIQTGMKFVTGKSGKKQTATPNLQNYAEIYRHYFAHNTRIIDIGTEGVPLSPHYRSYTDIHTYLADYPYAEDDSYIFDEDENEGEKRRNRIQEYLQQEKTALASMNNYLQGISDMPQTVFEEFLHKKDYLYLHFPDAAWGCSLESGFLKRIRLELLGLLKLFS